MSGARSGADALELVRCGTPGEEEGERSAEEVAQGGGGVEGGCCVVVLEGFGGGCCCYWGVRVLSGASKKMSRFAGCWARMEAYGVEPVVTIVMGPGTRAEPLW